MDELFQERRRELAFEGHLFFDIASMGRDLRRVDCNALQNVNIDKGASRDGLTAGEIDLSNAHKEFLLSCQDKHGKSWV